MTLTENNQFLEIITKISSELNAYKDKSKEELLTYCINDKLKTRLKEYGLESDLTSDFLMKQSSMRVFKAITKIKQREDKEAILAANTEDK